MKIYVTGLGVVSGIGIGVSENIEALRQRKHGIGKVTLFPTALDVPVSEVKRSNEELKQLISLPPQRTVSRTALLGMIAAKEAMKDAGLTPPLRIGFISATSVGGMDLSEHFYESFKKNPGQGRLREVISHDCGASTELIASYLGINDFITTISTACSSRIEQTVQPIPENVKKYEAWMPVFDQAYHALCEMYTEIAKTEL